MREPNFSESQLQQAANTAYIRRIFEHHGSWAFAHVPSLFAEFELGWDTAFYLPWLLPLPSENDEGCNFFLQYKLSGELTSPGAKEWPQWGVEYFRFKIPHSTRDASGSFVDDYHQWNRLKALANKSYPTFYATNSTLSKTELQHSLQAGNLLDFVPLLDVRTVTSVHKHVTFTPSSKSFALHSEKEETKKLSFASTLNLLAEGPQLSFETSIKKLISTLNEMGENDKEWYRDLERMGSVTEQALPQRNQAWANHLLLASFVRKHIGVELLWLPKKA
jgi:hypothetical protein